MGQQRERVVAIVDDDASVRRSVSNLLLSLGIHAESFSSAEAFLQSPYLAETACLVLDLRMPGIQGLELLAHLADAGQPIPAVILTAHGDDETRGRALRAGVIAFFLKPFRNDELINAIKSVMVHA